MAGIKLSHITKVYDNGKKAVDDMDLEFDGKEFIVIVGPSGCGKSTTLRMIAGLESITSGELYLNGKLANKLKPNSRGVAMVFQDNALFPQMTVYQNMAFGLKVKKLPKAEIDKKVRAAAELLGITDCLDRLPQTLSGGQDRRVALGRAMVTSPEYFLFDEPLNSLDMQLRTSLRSEILNLYNTLDSTFIYVTHDQAEAMTMGTRVVVMKDGRVRQVAPPDELYDRPADRFVAEFIGSPQMNIMRATFTLDGPSAKVNVCGTTFTSPAEKFEGVVGTEADVGLRPERITLDRNAATDAQMECTVLRSENLGADRYVYARSSTGGEIVFRTPPAVILSAGDKVSVYFDPSALHVFP